MRLISVDEKKYTYLKLINSKAIMLWATRFIIWLIFNNECIGSKMRSETNIKYYYLRFVKYLCHCN